LFLLFFLDGWLASLFVAGKLEMEMAGNIEDISPFSVARKMARWQQVPASPSDHDHTGTFR
jgi:hypothetical protein